MAHPRTPGKQEDRPKAITVDWIVVTVSVIGLTIVAAASLQAGEGGLASNLGQFLTR